MREGKSLAGADVVFRPPFPFLPSPLVSFRVSSQPKVCGECESQCSLACPEQFKRFTFKPLDVSGQRFIGTFRIEVGFRVREGCPRMFASSGELGTEIFLGDLGEGEAMSDFSGDNAADLL